MNETRSYIVFFDVDETIINIKSMFSFLKFYYFNKPYPQKLLSIFRFYFQVYRLKLLSNLKKPREMINLQYYKLYKNENKIILNALGEAWHAKCLNEIDNFYNRIILKEINFHKSRGAKIVLVSGSFSACLLPIANHVNADYVLATSLETLNGRCTGEILNYPIIGEGKARIIKSYLHQIGYKDYSDCYAYGDHISDLPMLSLVGNPVVVANDNKLIKYAKQEGWRIIIP